MLDKMYRIYQLFPAIPDNRPLGEREFFLIIGQEIPPVLLRPSDQFLLNGIIENIYHTGPSLFVAPLGRTAKMPFKQSACTAGFTIVFPGKKHRQIMFVCRQLHQILRKYSLMNMRKHLAGTKDG